MCYDRRLSVPLRHTPVFGVNLFQYFFAFVFVSQIMLFLAMTWESSKAKGFFPILLCQGVNLG